MNPYRIIALGRPELVTAAFPEAVVLGDGEYDVPACSIAKLNGQLRDAIDLGVLLVSVTPVHSALEQQFREAVAR